MMEYEYLTDEELEKLISDVETEGLMMAPPSLIDDVMEQIERAEDVTKESQSDDSYLEPTKREVDKPPKVIDFDKKQKEYRRYCIRVMSSVAAAIAFVFLYLGGMDVQTEIISSKESVMMQEVQTREEVLQQEERLTSKLYESRRFSELWQNGIFK